MSTTRNPTVNDLRVKLCFICREEEPYDAVYDGPARSWTHPCNCTLVAHEKCLLEWIQSAQGESPERARNALKCPQCGTKYEIESKKSLLLNVLDAIDRILQRAGSMFTMVSVVGIIGVMGSGIYITLTAYGAWAVRQFVGKEMFDVLLTDDPSNWPWTAFMNLPLLPISLISSRISSSPKYLSMFLPIVLVWPPSPVAHQWMHHEPWHKRDRPNSPRLRAWPPSPVIFGLFIAPIVKLIYKRLMHRIAFRIFGANLSDAGRNSGVLYLREGPLLIRFRANIEAAHPDEGVAPNAANAAVVHDNDPPQGPNAAVLAATENIIRKAASSLGRRVGGALLIPYISNVMGNLLLVISKHSHILREFLGIKQHRRLLNGLPPSVHAYPLVNPDFVTVNSVMGEGLRKLGQLTASAVGNLWGGTKAWAELEPVWWRNTIGLGLFVVARDFLYISHLWLLKCELESRKVKNKDFIGIDIEELNLVPSFPIPSLRSKQDPKQDLGAEIVSNAFRQDVSRD